MADKTGTYPRDGQIEGMVATGDAQKAAGEKLSHQAHEQSKEQKQSGHEKAGSTKGHSSLPGLQIDGLDHKTSKPAAKPADKNIKTGNAEKKEDKGFFANIASAVSDGYEGAAKNALNIAKSVGDGFNSAFHTAENVASTAAGSAVEAGKVVQQKAHNAGDISLALGESGLRAGGELCKGVVDCVTSHPAESVAVGVVAACAVAAVVMSGGLAIPAVATGLAALGTVVELGGIAIAGYTTGKAIADVSMHGDIEKLWNQENYKSPDVAKAREGLIKDTKEAVFADATLGLGGFKAVGNVCKEAGAALRLTENASKAGKLAEKVGVGSRVVEEMAGTAGGGCEGVYGLGKSAGGGCKVVEEAASASKAGKAVDKLSDGGKSLKKDIRSEITRSSQTLEAEQKLAKAEKDLEAAKRPVVQLIDSLAKDAERAIECTRDLAGRGFPTFEELSGRISSIAPELSATSARRLDAILKGKNPEKDLRDWFDHLQGLNDQFVGKKPNNLNAFIKSAETYLKSLGQGEWKGVHDGYKACRKVVQESEKDVFVEGFVDDVVPKLYKASDAEDFAMEFGKSSNLANMEHANERLWDAARKLKQNKNDVIAAKVARGESPEDAADCVAKILKEYQKVWESSILQANPIDGKSLCSLTKHTFDQPYTNPYTLKTTKLETAIKDFMKDASTAAKAFFADATELDNGNVLLRQLDLGNSNGRVKGYFKVLDKNGEPLSHELHVFWNNKVPADVKFKTPNECIIPLRPGGIKETLENMAAWVNPQTRTVKMVRDEITGKNRVRTISDYFLDGVKLEFPKRDLANLEEWLGKEGETAIQNMKMSFKNYEELEKWLADLFKIPDSKK